MHLFCNMTGVPSFVAEVQHPVFGQNIMSEIDFASRRQVDYRWQGIRQHRVKF